MSDVEPDKIGIGPEFLKSLDPTQIGAVLSKLFAASIGDITVVLSQSPVHKHYSLADIEWMVIPPIAAEQFYVVEMMDKGRGFRTPVAVVTWAFLSGEADKRLQEETARFIRLRPDEWKSGEIAWLIDAVGTPVGVQAALKWLAAGPFKERALKIMLWNEHGARQVTTLDALMAISTEVRSART